MSAEPTGGAKEPSAPRDIEPAGGTSPVPAQDSPEPEPEPEPDGGPGVGPDAVQDEGPLEPNAWTVDDAESTAVTVEEAETAPAPDLPAASAEAAGDPSDDGPPARATSEPPDAEETGPDQPDQPDQPDGVGGGSESVPASAAGGSEADPSAVVPVVAGGLAGVSADAPEQPERPEQAESQPEGQPAQPEDQRKQPDQPEQPDLTEQPALPDRPDLPEAGEPVQPEGPRSHGDPVLAGGAAPQPRPALTGWAAVTAAVRPHPATRGQLLAGVLCAVLGFALVVQVHQVNTSGLSALRQADLVQVLARVTGESARLEEEAAGLAQAREKLANGDVDREAAQASARQRLQVLAILAGTAPARGPGLKVTITDPKGRVGAAEILDAVQELRDAGAEAIQIEGGGRQVRIVASTSFVDADGGLGVGGTVVHAPFTVRVLGDPDTLAAALKIPGGVDDVLRGLGSQVSVTPEQDLLVSALATPVHYRYSRPAG